jgi:hypothetical protein
MIKRIEFHLNLDDPRAIYQALKPSLRYRRAGEVIRQALDRLLVPMSEAHKPQMLPSFDQQEKPHE